MKYFLLLILSVPLFAAQEPMRFDTVPDVPSSEFTFETAPMRGEPYSLGLVKKESVRGFISVSPSKEFLGKELVIPNKFSLSQFAELAPVKNQGNCGSCVSFAVSAAVEDQYRILGKILPTLSNQYQMSCGKREWICNGSFFEKTASDYTLLNGNITQDKYPYTASNSSCKGKVSDTIAQIKNPRVIDNSPKSIITALLTYHAVPVTVGADNYFLSYKGGIYNACTNAGTNHQVELVGYDLEGAQFDANGKLPAGKGTWLIKNSWGTRYGEAGYITMKMTSSSGRLCNNIAEEAGVFDVDLPTPTPTHTPTPTPAPPTPSNLDWKWLGIGFAILLSIAGSLFAIFKK